MSNWNYYLALNSDAQMLVSAEFIEGNKIELCVIVKLKGDVEIFLLCVAGGYWKMKKKCEWKQFFFSFLCHFCVRFLAFYPLFSRYIVSIQKKINTQQ